MSVTCVARKCATRDLRAELLFSFLATMVLLPSAELPRDPHLSPFSPHSVGVGLNSSCKAPLSAGRAEVADPHSAVCNEGQGPTPTLSYQTEHSSLLAHRNNLRSSLLPTNTNGPLTGHDGAIATWTFQTRPEVHRRRGLMASRSARTSSGVRLSRFAFCAAA